MRGKEYTIFYVSLETKVPQDGATRPTAVNYPIARKYLYFLLGLKTGRGVKLIRINRLPFFFLHVQRRTNARHLYGSMVGEGKAFKGKMARSEGRGEERRWRVSMQF